MQQYTSEEALNGILNIIDTVVKLHAEALTRKPDNNFNEVGDLVTTLLGGVTAGSSNNVNLGSQIKDLANGMSIFKEKGITDSDAKNVAGMISTLGNSIKELEFSETNINSVQSVALALVIFGSIDNEIINRINNLSNIDFAIARKINEFINTLGNVDVNIDEFIKQLEKLNIDFNTVEKINNLNNIDFNLSKKLNDFLNDFNNIDLNFDEFIKTISNIGVSDEIIENINKWNNIDFSIVEKMNNFINKLGNVNVNIDEFINQLRELNIDNTIVELINNLNNIDFNLSEKINSFLNNINNVDMNFDEFIKSMSNIGMSDEVIYRINNLSNIDFNIAEKIKEFISTLSNIDVNLDDFIKSMMILNIMGNSYVEGINNLKLIDSNISNNIKNFIENISDINLDVENIQKALSILVLTGSINKEKIDNINFLNDIDFNIALKLSQFLNTLGNVDSDISEFIKQISKFNNIDEQTISNINSLSSIDCNLSTILKTAFENINDIDINSKSVLNIINTLNKLGNIDNNIISNLSSLRPDLARQIVDFLNAFTLIQYTDKLDINVAKDVLNFIKKLNDISFENTSLDVSIATNIKDFINSFNNIQTDTDNIKKAIETIVLISQIDKNTLKNIEKLSDIDYSGIDKLKEFLNKLNFSVSGEVDLNVIRRDVSTIISLLKSVTDIVDGEQFKFSTLFAPTRGKLMGKAIANFFKSLIEAVDGKEIKVEIKGIADLMNGILPLVKNDSEYSIRRMKKILNGKNGEEIGAFFEELLKKFPTDKDVKNSIGSVANLMKILSEFSIKDYVKMKNILTEKNGQEIGKFFQAILKDLPEKNAKGLKSISDFLKDLSSIGMLGAMTLKLMSFLLNEKTGKAINGFASNLIDGFDKEKSDQVKTFAESMKLLSSAMMMLSGTMLMMASGILLFGVETILASVALTVAFTAGMLYVLKKFSDADKDGNIKNGSEALQNISKAITLLTLDVIMLAGVAVLMESVAWESLGKVGAIFGSLVVAVWISQVISDKWNNGGEQALKAIQGISLLLVAAVASVALMAWISQEFSHKDVEYGLITLGIVVSTSISIVWMLSKMNQKDTENSLKTLWNIIGIISVTALVIGFVIAPLATQLIDAIAGLTVVGVTVLAMIGFVALLNRMDSKDVEESRKTLMVLTFMFTIIAAVSAFILPMIALNVESASIGAIFSLVVVGAMILMTKWVANIDKKTADEVQQTLMILTGMFAIVSICAAILLPMIGAQIENAFIGLVVVTAIIAGMYFMTKLLSNIENDVLELTHKTLGVLTVMLVAVSLIAAYILPLISERAADAFVGGLVVLGIITLMVGITWLMSRIEQDTLKTTYTALAVLTTCLLAVSLIALFILPTIGEQWESTAAGGIVVMGIIALMVLMVWGLSKIDDKSLIKSVSTLVVMTFILLGVSLIARDILSEVGKMWDDVLIGGVLVLGIISLMGLIIAATGLMDWKTIGKGTATLVAVAAMLATIGYIMTEYIVPIGKDAKNATQGSLLIVGLVGSFSLIIAAAGQMDLKTIGKGALAIASVGLLLYGLSKVLEEYLPVALNMQKNAKNIAIGSLEIVALLGSWGLIFAGIGALVFGPQAALLAAGEAAIASIGVVLYTLANLLPSYIDLTKKVFENKKYINSGSNLIKSIIKQFSVLAAEIGVMMMIPGFALVSAGGAAAVAVVGTMIKGLAQSIDPFADLLKKINDYKINQSTVKNFHDLMIKGDNSLFTSIKEISEKMEEIGLYTSAKVAIIVKNLRPIFQTISEFIDVVGKLCSMKYPTEFDENGKPVAYDNLSISMFKGAANTVSSTFRVFLDELSAGMKSFEDVSLATVAKLSISIGPVISAVSKYTDAVLKVLSSKIECEWDSEGKPIKYRKFDASDFLSASKVIADGFSTFLTTLSVSLAPIHELAGSVLKSLKDGIEPVMNAVATFTNSVESIMYGHEMTVTENGKEVKKWIKFDANKFKEAGKTISIGFMGFIDNLYNHFKDFEITETEYEAYLDKKSYAWGLYSKETTKYRAKTVHKNKIGILLSNLGDVGTIIGAVKDFTDLILTTADNKNFNKLGSLGILISSSFNTFVDNLCKKFVGTGIEEKIKTTIDGLKDVRKLVGSFSTIFKELQKTLLNENNLKITVALVNNSYDVLSSVCSVKNLNKLKNMNSIDIEGMKSMVSYSKLMRNVAKQLSKLAEEMNTVDITLAINKFLTDIELLTQTKSLNRVSASQKALKQFGGDLKVFTNQVVLTRKTVIKFSNSMHDATKSLKKFDDLLINNEKKRNESIKHMAELIERTAEAVKSLLKNIESLDLNKVLSNFRSISELLELAKAEGQKRANPTNSNNNNQQNTNLNNQKQHSQNNSGNTTIINGKTLGRTMVNFYFNTSAPLTGYMETKQY